MSWTKTPPEPPNNGRSMWYWYEEEGLRELVVMEVWPNRDLKRFDGWWWSHPIPKPEERIIKRKYKTKRRIDNEQK